MRILPGFVFFFASIGVLSGFFGGSPRAFAQQSPLVIQQSVLDFGNGEKDFSIQHFKSGRALVQMGLAWIGFDPAVHSKGFKLTYARSVQVLSPALPQKCAVISVFGFLNGIEGFRNFLSLALKGKDCKTFTDALTKEPLSIVFGDVPALDATKAVTPWLKLDVQGSPVP